MHQEVDCTEERKAALALFDAEAPALQGEALCVFQDAVVSKALVNADAIAQGLIGLASEGHGPSIKLLIEILEDHAKNRTGVTAPIVRSLAEEWGVEPDWSDGCCILCAK
jgi:hypothetical protein